MGILSVRMGTRKQYPDEIKAKIVLEILKEEKSIAEILKPKLSGNTIPATTVTFSITSTS